MCLGTDTGDSIYENQGLMGTIGGNKARASFLEATMYALSITPIYTPARLTPIMAAANKYYKLYKQNPDKIDSTLAQGVTTLRVSHS